MITRLRSGFRILNQGTFIAMNAAAALRRAGIASTAQQVSMVLASSFPRRGLKRWMKSGSRMKKTSDAKSPSTSSSQVLQASSSPANSRYAVVLQTPGSPSPAAAVAAHVGHALQVSQSGHETSQSGAASDRTSDPRLRSRARAQVVMTELHHAALADRHADGVV